MRRAWGALAPLFLIIASPVQPRVAVPHQVDVKLAHGSPAELATKRQLERLLSENDLSRWIFTRSIVIDANAIPHSHPILTLHTRHLKDDDLLLSTFLHEQLHWFLVQRQEQTERAVAELRNLYPSLPVGFPDGAETLESDYIHLLVNYLEYQADRAVMGELRAKAVMEFWSSDHYRKIYQQVLEHPQDIRSLVEKYELNVPE